MNSTLKRLPQRIPEVLTEVEQARLLAQFDDDSPSSIRGRAIILDTGLRASELINLRIRDLDLATGRLAMVWELHIDPMVFIQQGACRSVGRPGAVGPEDWV